MGKITGFMEYARQTSAEVPPLERIANYDEFHIPLPREEQQRQAARCMECGVPFCQSGLTIGGMTSGCPLNNMIPEWNDLVYRGKWELALHRLLVTNRFPEFTGRVCPAPCEAACTCNLSAGQAVCIKENEHRIIEHGYEAGLMKPCPPPVRTGKSVAVVGSGPAGLAAAELLNKRGHLVTVYERSDRVGGLLMYGIPNMKLEKSVIERRVQYMQEEGVVFEINCDVGANVTAQQLLAQYDAVVLCCGAARPRDIEVPGRQAQGIYFAVDYLTSVTRSLLDSRFSDEKAITAKDRHVLVIGGGDTGNDCVATALRQGCAGVTQLEMLPQPPAQRAAKNPWPEWPRVLKTDYGQQEAIAVFGQDPRIYQAMVKEFLTDETGRVTQAVVQRLALCHDAAAGRSTMQPTGEEFTLQADLVLIAAGFTGCQPYVPEAFGAMCTPAGTVETKAYKTTAEKVFAAGDMRRGQSLVVWALREGMEVARAVDSSLMGYTNL